MNSKVSTALQAVLICHLPLALETIAAALVALSVTQRLAINQPLVVGIHSRGQGYGSLYAVAASLQTPCALRCCFGVCTSKCALKRNKVI